MPTKNKKFLITSALREQIVVRKSRLRWRKMICPPCGIETEMLTLDSAVTLSGIATRRLIELAAQNALHSSETGSGHLLFCRRSLENFSQIIRSLEK